jgi:hypothetical protein
MKQKKQCDMLAFACRDAKNILASYASEFCHDNDQRVQQHIKQTIIKWAYLYLVTKNGKCDDFVFATLPKDVRVVGEIASVLGPACNVDPTAESMSSVLAGVTCDLERKKRGAFFTPYDMAWPIVRKTMAPLARAMTQQHGSEKRLLSLRVCDPSCGGGVFLVGVVRWLANHLVERVGVKNKRTAKRLAAIHCVYGVDRDPCAVLASKLALRIECEAFEMPDDWLDDNIKCGDALVGLTANQIKKFTYYTKPKESLPEGANEASKKLHKKATNVWETTPDNPSISSVVDEATRLGVEARKQRMKTLSAIAARG